MLQVSGHNLEFCLTNIFDCAVRVTGNSNTAWVSQTFLKYCAENLLLAQQISEPIRSAPSAPSLTRPTVIEEQNL